VLSEERQDAGWAIASDVMHAPVTVKPEDDLRTAAERMVKNRLRALLVIDGEGRIVGLLDESEIAKVYLRAAARADENTSEIVLRD
jgi:chloride channel protein, CIC family